MTTKPKQPEKQLKKPKETKIYHGDEDTDFINRRVRDGKFRNRQHYWNELLRQDKLKHSR